MGLIIFVLTMVGGYIIFQKYKSIFGPIYFGHKRMIFDYCMCCFLVLLILSIIVFVLKSLLFGLVVGGGALLVIFILEKVLGDRMPFGVKNKVVQLGAVAICFISAIGYGVYYFTSDDEGSDQTTVSELEENDVQKTYAPSRDSNQYAEGINKAGSQEETKQSSQETESFGKYMGVEVVTQYEGVNEINVMTENRVLVKLDDEYSIYDENFTEIQALGKIDVLEFNDDYILYSQKLFQDGNFETAYGIFDLDGNIVESPNLDNDRIDVEEVYNKLTLEGHEMKPSINRFFDPDTGLVGLSETKENMVGILEEEVVVQPQYEDIQINNSIQQEYAFKDTDGKWGIINSKGDIILDPVYSSIEFINSVGNNGNSIDKETDSHFIIYNASGEKGIFFDNVLFEPQFSYESEIQILDGYVIVFDETSTIVYNGSGETVKKFDNECKITKVKHYREKQQDKFFTVCNNAQCGVMGEDFEWLFKLDNYNKMVYSLGNEIFFSIVHTSYPDMKNVEFYDETGKVFGQLGLESEMGNDPFLGFTQEEDMFIFGNSVYKFILNPDYKEIKS